mmetsp:Transcript_6734/g.16249  ORF Transcript_6734/g.16249 Transcript_6734/m.16249 type:complete len:240 (-) Transcript_6734:2219-2938(-)
MLSFFFWNISRISSTASVYCGNTLEASSPHLLNEAASFFFSFGNSRSSVIVASRSEMRLRTMMSFLTISMSALTYSGASIISSSFSQSLCTSATPLMIDSAESLITSARLNCSERSRGARCIAFCSVRRHCLAIARSATTSLSLLGRFPARPPVIASSSWALAMQVRRRTSCPPKKRSSAVLYSLIAGTNSFWTMWMCARLTHTSGTCPTAASRSCAKICLASASRPDCARTVATPLAA